MMNLDSRGFNFIKQREGCKLVAYLCTAGRPTVGYGHTGTVNGAAIKPGVTTITLQKAEQLFRNDLIAFEKVVNAVVKVPLVQNQFDALVSFAYNVGAGAFQNSTLVKLLNQKKYNSVPAQFMLWNKVPSKGRLVEDAGLTLRRKAEVSLFGG